MLLAATTTIWLGRSLSLQLLGRAFQGAAASMLWITGLAMVADAVGSNNVVQYSGYVSISLMFGSYVRSFHCARLFPNPLPSPQF
jgi:MFS family permease